jgi:hypothetical protein
MKNEAKQLSLQQTGTTRYTSSRRTTVVLAAVLLFTLVAPFLVLIDEDGVRRISEEFARNRLGFAAGGIFWLVLLTIIIAGVRANYLMVITCGPEACRYRLPHVSTEDFFRRPFALRTGEIPYSMISGVEKRREKLRKRGLTCSAVCLIIRDQPLRTFVRGGVGDHQWVETFARDIAARAHVPLVDRGTAPSMWAPWR